MTTETVLPFNRDAVTAQSKTNGEPDWLRELRLEAMAAAAVLNGRSWKKPASTGGT